MELQLEIPEVPINNNPSPLADEGFFVVDYSVDFTIVSTDTSDD